MPRSDAIRYLGYTRIGSLVIDSLRVLDRFRMTGGEHWELKVEATRGYLERLREYTDANDIELLVLLIPTLEDLIKPGWTYRAAKELFEELDLAVLDPAPRLSDASYAVPPNPHWNDEGHRIAGQLLAECVQRLMGGDELARCVQLSSGD